MKTSEEVEAMLDRMIGDSDDDVEVIRDTLEWVLGHHGDFIIEQYLAGQE